MAERVNYLLLGGGLAAASAARAIRERDEDGRIVLVAAEDELPYHRPPLSKSYMKGQAERENLAVQRAAWYEKRGIEVRRGARAEEVDTDHRLVRLAGGETLEYERCLIATGGRARRLELPGSELEGIYTLRTVRDSERIRGEAAAAESVVIVGASFIGMELASAFAEAGLKTTVVEMAPRVWPKVTDDVVASFFRRYFEERGVEFVLEEVPGAFEGNGRVSAVRTKSGRRLPCDFAALGVGIELNLGLLDGSGAERSNGVVVDDRLRSSAEHLYAAGDVASYPDPVFGKRMRIEHWDNAKAQGTHVGQVMAGADAPYDHMSYFFSDVFDLSLHVVGDADDYDRILVRGSLDDASFTALYVREDVLTAALTVNREWSELESAKSLIREHTEVRDEERWIDPDVPLGGPD